MSSAASPNPVSRISNRAFWLILVVVLVADARRQARTPAFVFVVGLGMGTCFGTLFDIAIGDIDPKEAGPASGSLAAVQQLAGSIGSAVILSIWLGHRAGGASSPVVTCLAVVAAVTLCCCALVALLPRKAREEAR